MESGMSSSKEKEVIVDIDIDNKDHEAQVNKETEQGKRSSDKLASGALNYNGSGDGEASAAATTTATNSRGSFDNTCEPSLELLVDKNLEERQRLMGKGHKKERRKGGKVKKAAKPPRPPNGPTLSAADLRMIDELARMAMIKKRERIERAKALKMMQAGRGSQLPAVPISSTQGATVFAMVITVVFLLVIIFQGFVSNAGSGSSPSAAPQPAPHTLLGMSPLQFYKTFSSDDDGSGSGAAPSTSTDEAGKGITINRKF